MLLGGNPQEKQIKGIPRIKRRRSKKAANRLFMGTVTDVGPCQEELVEPWLSLLQQSEMV